MNEFTYIGESQQEPAPDVEYKEVKWWPVGYVEKEWPAVGDDVETSDGKGVVKLLPDSKGYYIVSVDGEYYQYQIDELSKPKTLEEELRDELISAMDNSNTAFQYAEYLSKAIINGEIEGLEYKPQ